MHAMEQQYTSCQDISDGGKMSGAETWLAIFLLLNVSLSNGSKIHGHSKRI